MKRVQDRRPIYISNTAWLSPCSSRRELRIFEKGRISGDMKRKFISDIVRDRVEGVESPIVVGWEILEDGDGEDFVDFLRGQYERETGEKE